MTPVYKARAGCLSPVFKLLAAALVSAAAAGTATAAAPPPRSIALKVDRTGIHRVTYETLRGAGLDLSGVPASDLSLTCQGRPTPVYVGWKNDAGKGAAPSRREGARRGAFGPGAFVEFFGEALDTLYTDTNVYRLGVDRGGAVGVGAEDATPPADAPPALSYAETLEGGQKREYSYSSPGGDGWFDTSMLAHQASKSWDFPFSVDGLADPPAPAELELVLWGITNWPQSPDHHVVASLNGVAVSDEKFDGHVVKALKLQLPPGLLKEGQNVLRLTLPGDTGAKYDMVNLARFGVAFQREFAARDGRLAFSAAGDVFRVTGLTGPDISVYRVEEGRAARLKNVRAEPSGGSWAAVFAGSARPCAYAVASAGAAHAPKLEMSRAVGAADRPAQYLVIAHPSFIPGLRPLVDARRAQGLTVGVVDVTDLYARYTHGVFDPAAIKRHIAHAVKNLGAKYVLLVGGDTTDYRHRLGVPSTSFIPSLYSAAGRVRLSPADPLYADVDDDGSPDVAIGRLPVRGVAELDAVVSKTLSYAAKSYRRTALFAADKNDGYYSFKSANDAMAAGLPAGWSAERVCLDDEGAPEAAARISGAMNRGVALVVFSGHSSPRAWTFGDVFNVKHAAALTNAGRPFVAVQWGCWNTYFVDPAKDSLTARLLLSGDRGAAAVFGATTVTEFASESLLGELLTPRLASPGTTIGQALLDAKRELAKKGTGMSDVLLGWTLLGDPALVVEPLPEGPPRGR